MQIILAIYILGFLYVLVTELSLGERLFVALLKSILSVIWIVIVWLNKTGKNT